MKIIIIVIRDFVSVRVLEDALSHLGFGGILPQIIILLKNNSDCDCGSIGE
ncbi:hypothetical protein LguiA_010041 [Lonicera macranthoides]